MAITAAQLQTALGDGVVMGARVLNEYGVAGTLQVWRIRGGYQYPGREKMVVTTAADNATNQAVTVRAALLNGPTT